MKCNKASIRAVASFVPDNVLSNQDLEKIVDTSDAWIYERSGIKERRIAPKEKPTSWMAAKVVQQLLHKSGLNKQDIDGLIVATITPDMFFPNTANRVAFELGMTGLWTYDLMAACSGFIFALSQATAMIESGRYKNIIVVGADKMSSIVDYTDRSTCILFGDAAGGVLISANQENETDGIHDFVLGSEPDEQLILSMKAGGSLHPASIETVAAKEHFISQNGQIVFKIAVRKLCEISGKIMQKNSLQPTDIRWLVPHQANQRIITYVAQEMNISIERVMLNIHKYGNTTAATIPLCLSDYESQIKKGDKLMLIAFGGGFSFASSYLSWAY